MNTSMMVNVPRCSYNLVLLVIFIHKLLLIHIISPGTEHKMNGN